MLRTRGGPAGACPQYRSALSLGFMSTIRAFAEPCAEVLPACRSPSDIDVNPEFPTQVNLPLAYSSTRATPSFPR